MPKQDNEFDVDVLLKSEFHTSLDDARRELEIIKSHSWDAIVIEGARQSVEEFPSFTFSDWIVSWTFFFLGPMFVDSQAVIYTALKKGLTPFYTRETEGDVIEELPLILPVLVKLVWVALIVLTFGLAVVGEVVASLLPFTAAFAIPLLIRIVRNYTDTSVNRNAKMAEQVITAQQTSGKTIAILGGSHAEKVAAYLPDDIKVEVETSSYQRRISIGFAKDLVRASPRVLFRFFSYWLGIAMPGLVVGVILI